MRAVAERWAEEPGPYNPLLLVGASGVGKSLLAELLVTRFRERYPEEIVISTTGADFARSHGAAQQADGLDEFRRKYRRAQLLLVEHLDELVDKQNAQNELRFTVDELLTRQARIIVTARSHPTHDGRVAAGLASRLSAGLVLPLRQPQHESRASILAFEAARLGLELPENLLGTLAQTGTCSLRQLRRLVGLIAWETKSRGRTLDRALIAELLLRENAQREVGLPQIVTQVARRLRVKVGDVRGPSRRRSVAYARGMAMLLARRLSDVSYQHIGRHFGGRDHTTVMHACRKTSELLEQDPASRVLFDELLEKLSP